METLISPGVFLRENDVSQITQGPITVGAALIGPTVLGPVNLPTLVRSYSEYKAKFGSLFITGGANFEYLTSIAAYNYFQQGGESLLVTRVVSGTFTSATSSIPGVTGVAAKATASIPGFADGTSFQLTGSVAGLFTITSSRSLPADTGTNYYVALGNNIDTTLTNIKNKINTLKSTFSIIADSVGGETSGYNGPTLILTASTVGIAGNSYRLVSGSTSNGFTGGVEPTASFVLETISQGTIMNNSNNVTGSNSVLPSGSVNNVRWEITTSDPVSGLFSLIIRRGDDYDNSKTVLETWSNLSLDPNQATFISYVIGDQVISAATDANGDGYLTYNGSYVNRSNYVRVKSVNLTTPNYFGNNGTATPAYTSSLPAIGTGQYQGSFGGANGIQFTTAGALNMFDRIPVSTAAGYSTSNVQGLLPDDYNRAISLLVNKDQYDFKTIYAPGLTVQNASTQVGDLLNLAATRGTCIAVVDMVTANQEISTVTSQAATLDSSYGATYWPWVQLRSQETGKLFFCPASTIVPAAYEYNDKVAAEWFAPAGLNRGGLSTVIQPQRRLTVSQRDTLYSAKINPIAIFPGQGTVIYGQKTLQSKASALDRVNVRRLLINLKRYIGQVAETLLFEQNTQTTRNNFLNKVNPYMQYVQQRQGLFTFKVVMDDTNNTADVIDRNQLVGQIYLQPTRTAEYILIDFNILPTGATFGA